MKNVYRHFYVLLVGLLLATPAAAKNVILMISDGMGFSTVIVTDYYHGKRAVYGSFPEKYIVTTYNAKGDYRPDIDWGVFGSHKRNLTDSAAAATAMATGVKTIDGRIGKDIAGNPIENIATLATSLGMATGLVTSVPISHATPAAMLVHENSRKNYENIAQKMFYASDLDVLMGAGHPLYDNNGKLKTWGKQYRYVGGKRVFKELTGEEGLLGKDGKRWLFMDAKADFEALARGDLVAKKVLGLAKVGTTLQQGRLGDVQVVNTLNRNISVPDLSVMGLGALRVLSTNPQGFFLMIEGGAIDWAGHRNQKGRMIEEQGDFNDAVAAVSNWVETYSSWDETLLIVTSDHECGYLWGSAHTFAPVQDQGLGKMPVMGFHSNDHSNLLVPFYGKGDGISVFLKGLVKGQDTFFAKLIAPFDADFTGDYIDNTGLFFLMREWLSGKKCTEEAVE